MFPAFKVISSAVEAVGGFALLVGGAVRDSVLGLEPKDCDIEVYGLSLENLNSVLSSVADDGKVNAVGSSFGVLKIKIDGEDVDVSIPRRDNKTGQGHKGFVPEFDAALTPKEAASRRDFTMNALALDKDCAVIDHFGGLADICALRLRPTSAAFSEDPLRVLRGMQFAGRFQMSASSECRSVCASMVGSISELPKERIWGEFEKWATKSVKPSMGLEFLRDCGWLIEFQELNDLIGVEQFRGWHPEGDVWNHTLLAVDAAAFVAMRDGFAKSDRLVAVLGALCHDFGKVTTTTNVKGVISSAGHPEAGEAPTRSFLASIGCPPDVIESVVLAVIHHMAHVCGGNPDWNRMARRLAVKFDGRLSAKVFGAVLEADHSARPPLPGGQDPEALALLAAFAANKVESSKPKNLLSGKILMSLGMKPGPQMGVLQREAFELQLDGAISTVEQATAWAKNRLSKP